MPNPFPGMDPYLEGDLWITVRTDLSSQIARQLAPLVRPRYAVMSRNRSVMAPPDEEYGSGPEPIPHVSIEIRELASRRLATWIEVLSATNKCGPGKKEYADLRTRVLLQDANLVEIDLLRVGESIPDLSRLPYSPYRVAVTRQERYDQLGVWPAQIADRLPIIAIPLSPQEGGVALDLQEALTVVYDIFGYDEMVDYTQPPPGPLTPAEAEWIDQRLRRAGRRS